MRLLDWAVLAASLVGIVAYGMHRSRGRGTTREYLLAGKTMPWYAMALSIMATQASAITFISTTGQAYVDGMRFVQFYLGLPVAMVILCATAVPIFHRANVYTAYEYLEQRFDAKTRTLVSAIFLVQRGLAVGLALYAPAIVLAVILGWPDRLTTLIMGAIVVAYTAIGGIKAVTWTDVQQMLVIFAGLIVAFIVAVAKMPADVSFLEAVELAGAAGRLNAIDFRLDPHSRYTVWSGLLGGMFLALAYFGTDQSQVQRYLTGKSIAASRLSLLFNAIAKVPMQFFILFIGAIVFVFYCFEPAPLFFHPEEMKRLEASAAAAEAGPVQERFRRAWTARREAAQAWLEARRQGEEERAGLALRQFRGSQEEMERARGEGRAVVARLGGTKDLNDTNYIFLSFVTHYMPAGVVGLIIAAIFAAAMSTISAEINSLATVSVIDVYRRHIVTGAADGHYLWASRGATLFWGAYAVAFAEYGRNLGALIEAVNIVGSLFYGGMLGVFVLAFFFPQVKGTAAFFGLLGGEAAIFAAHFFSGISFLWYNVLGCLVTVLVGLMLSAGRDGRGRQPQPAGGAAQI